MKQIYIVLTSTGTLLYKIIRFYTKDEFSHVSISLDRNLTQMYSFGRHYAYNPFYGGFVHEYIDKGTFKRFYNTKTRVYSLDIEDEQYEILKNTIADFEEKRNILKFNFIGLVGVGFDKKLKRKNYFYCAEFLKYLFDKAGIQNNLPELTRPESFKQLNSLNQIYSGLLRNYSTNEQKEKVGIT